MRDTNAVKVTFGRCCTFNVRAIHRKATCSNREPAELIRQSSGYLDSTWNEQAPSSLGPTWLVHQHERKMNTFEELSLQEEGLWRRRGAAFGTRQRNLPTEYNSVTIRYQAIQGRTAVFLRFVGKGQLYARRSLHTVANQSQWRRHCCTTAR